MKSYSLNAKKRIEIEKGKNQVGRLRRSGRIPGNLISKGKSSLLSFGEKDFKALVIAGLGTSSLIQLALEGEESSQAIVKELQRHPVNGELLHVDFYKVSKGEAFWVKVAVEPRGLSKGIKAGGALEQYINNLDVRTAPESLQEVVEIDITNLEKGESIYFKDLNLPKEWEVGMEGNPIVLKVAHARVTVSSTTEETEEHKESSETAGSESKPIPKT